MEKHTAERAAADARYNAALTALDAAVMRAAPPVVPASKLADLLGTSFSAETTILPPTAPGGSGWRGRLAAFIWRIVGPVFTRQQTFNEALSEHASRVERGIDHLARLLLDQAAARRADMEALATFQSLLMQFLQQITPFVDTKIRVLDAANEDLRMIATSAQRTAISARRAVEELGTPDGTEPATLVNSGKRASPAGASWADATNYVGFEDLFRGSDEQIRARQAADADRFAGASDVIDIGCGRGEMLQLLAERGVRAMGIDSNPAMVEACRTRGLKAECADALAHLAQLPDASLGGLIAVQVLEHLEPEYLVRLINVAHAKLRPGAPVVLETINAACWVAFFESYIRDVTHVRPLHPDTLKFLVIAAGFESVTVEFRSPVEASGRLQRISEEGLPPQLLDAVRTVNGNVDRLNERLFTFLDFAVLAVREQ